MASKAQPIETIAKAQTGITGLDEITAGGWPRGRVMLIEGAAGVGKTIFALQSLVNGAVLFNERGIFVAFEESSKHIVANAAKFGWDLLALQERDGIMLTPTLMRFLPEPVRRFIATLADTRPMLQALGLRVLPL